LSYNITIIPQDLLVDKPWGWGELDCEFGNGDVDLSPKKLKCNLK
jgi:hypothetical protein